MAERLRGPVAVLLLAALAAFIGNGIENEQLRGTFMGAASLLVVIGLAVGVYALLKRED
jgi:hypothetical protein